MINLIQKDWLVFLEVAETENMTKAAEKLGLPQPSVSKYISLLEKKIGTQLVYRSNRGASLSPTGRRLFRLIKESQETLNNLIPQELLRAQEPKGRVRFGSHRVLAESYLSTELANLCSEYPDLDLELSFANSSDVVRKILDHEIDLGVVANFQKFKGLVHRPLGTEKIAVYGASPKDPDVVFLNPEMQGLPRIVKYLKAKKLVYISDYSLCAHFALSSPRAAAVLPFPVAEKTGLDHIHSPVFYSAKISLVWHENLPPHKIFEVVKEKFLRP